MPLKLDGSSWLWWRCCANVSRAEIRSDHFTQMEVCERSYPFDKKSTLHSNLLPQFASHQRSLIWISYSHFIFVPARVHSLNKFSPGNRFMFLQSEHLLFHSLFFSLFCLKLIFFATFDIFHLSPFYFLVVVKIIWLYLSV